MSAAISRYAIAWVVMLAAAAATSAAEKSPTTQPEIGFRIFKTPHRVEIFQEDPLLTEGFKYVAVIRARAAALAPNDVRGTLAEFVRRTPREHLASEDIRSFLATQGGRAIRIRFAHVLRPGPVQTGTAGQPPGPTGAGMPQPLPAMRGGSPRQMSAYSPRSMPEPSGGGMMTTGSAPGPYGVGGRPRGVVAPRQAVVGTAIREFLILAPSEDRAKQLVAALIVVYNQGWAHPQRQLHLEQADALEAELPRLQAKLREAEARQAEVQAQIDKCEDIGADALSALKAEKWLLEVRLTGIKARLEAAEKILATEKERARVRNDPSVHAAPLEKILIDGRIELADLLARQARVGELVKSGTRRAQLWPRAGQAVREVKAAKERLATQKRSVASYRASANSEQVAPFELLDDQVPIHPIQWIKVAAGPRPTPRPSMFGPATGGASIRGRRSSYEPRLPGSGAAYPRPGDPAR